MRHTTLESQWPSTQASSLGLIQTKQVLSLVCHMQQLQAKIVPHNGLHFTKFSMNFLNLLIPSRVFGLLWPVRWGNLKVELKGLCQGISSNYWDWMCLQMISKMHQPWQELNRFPSSPDALIIMLSLPFRHANLLELEWSNRTELTRKLSQLW